MFKEGRIEVRVVHRIDGFEQKTFVDIPGGPGAPVNVDYAFVKEGAGNRVDSNVHAYLVDLLHHPYHLFLEDL